MFFFFVVVVVVFVVFVVVVVAVLMFLGWYFNGPFIPAFCGVLVFFCLVWLIALCFLFCAFWLSCLLDFVTHP